MTPGGSLGKTPVEFTLVLGGGGARGLAHIGVLEVLEGAKLSIAHIVGTSAGAIIGGMYATTPDAAAVRETVRDFLKGEIYAGVESVIQHTLRGTGGDVHTLPRLLLRAKQILLAKRAASSMGIFETELLRTIVDSLLPSMPISDCRIPFAAVAVNLRTGRTAVMSEGDLRGAVAASCAIPGFFPPQKHDGSLYIDGGTVSPMPVLEALSLDGTQRPIIAVDVGRDLESYEEVSNALEVVLRNESIAGYWLKRPHTERADIVIDPDVGHYTWSHVDQMDALIEAGRTAAREAIPGIEKLQFKAKGNILTRLLLRVRRA
jgi:NTE family protein